MKKTIVLTCNSSFGLVKFRMPLIRKLQIEGFHVAAVAPRDHYTAQLETIGIEFHEWELNPRNTHLNKEVRSLFKLFYIYKTLGPHLCIHYTIKAVIYGGLVARMIGIRYVSVITGLGYVFLNEGIYSRVARWAYRFLLNDSFFVYFLNRNDYSEFIHLRLVKKEKAGIIPGEGVDTEHFKPLVNKKIKISFLVISRILSDKGIFEFIDAVTILRDRGFNFEAKILGEMGINNPTGIPKHHIEYWVREGIIKYLGFKQDIRPILQNATCVVLPSYREGLPIALLEASSMAKPIIATNVPGCREVIIDGITGYLCEAKNPFSLAECMIKIIQMANVDRELMGKLGREHVKQNFSQRIVLDYYSELFEKLSRLE